MNVLFLSQIVPYPPHGGVLQRGFNLVRELGRQARVHLLAFVHPDELRSPEQVDEAHRVLAGFCHRVEFFPLWAKGTIWERAAALVGGLASPCPFSTVAHRSPPFRRALETAIATTPFDIVHVDTIALTPFVEPRPPVATVLTHHNIESMLMGRRAMVEKNRLARLVLGRESRKLARYEAKKSPTFDLNITMSEADAAALRAVVGPVRTAVVPNGVDTQYFRPAPMKETAAVVYTGGMNMFANRDAVLHWLADIWPLVTQRVPDVRFFAVGQDPPRELLDHAARDPRIVVTGRVPDVRPYVREAAIYIVPIRVGGGTRLKVLDAMSSGKAIVSTSIGYEGIDVRPGEHLLVGDTPVAFAEAVAALLGDEPRRRVLGAAARARVEQAYAWPVVGRHLMDAYRRAVAAHGETR